MKPLKMDVAMHEADGSSYTRVVTGVSCLMTRFRVRSVWGLLRLYRHYRKIRKAASSIDGLMCNLFLIEDSRTCFTVSFWKDAEAILEFNGTVREHLDAANSCTRYLEWSETGPTLWSAQFRLSAISPHNLRWNDFDVRQYVSEDS